MTKDTIQMVVRCILSFVMIYFSYKETGPWTAAIFVMMVISVEAEGWLVRKSFGASSDLLRLLKGGSR